MNFEKLSLVIEQTHLHFQQQANKAINVSLTLRNWLIGYYIVEFEQKGEDRATYGEKLLKSIANRISCRGLGETNLRLTRQFYQNYPEIGSILYSNFSNLLSSSIRQLLTDEFQVFDTKSIKIHQLATDELANNQSLTKTSNYYREIIERISFTHFIELIMWNLPSAVWMKNSSFQNIY